jgi:hypothetical protein
MVTINNFSTRASKDATADTRQIKVPCNFTPIVLLHRLLIFSWYSHSQLWSQLLTFNTDARLLVRRPYSVRVFLGSEVCCLVERHTVTRCDVTGSLYHPWWWSHFYQATRCQNTLIFNHHRQNLKCQYYTFNDAQLPTEIRDLGSPHAARQFILHGLLDDLIKIIHAVLIGRIFLFNLKDLKCPLSRAKEVCFHWMAVHNKHQ